MPCLRLSLSLSLSLSHTHIDWEHTDVHLCWISSSCSLGSNKVNLPKRIFCSIIFSPLTHYELLLLQSLACCFPPFLCISTSNYCCLTSSHLLPFWPSTQGFHKHSPELDTKHRCGFQEKRENIPYFTYFQVPRIRSYWLILKVVILV